MLAPIQNPTSQDNLPEIGKKVADKAKRAGVAEHFPEPSVRKTIERDLTLIDHYDKRLSAVELSITRTAKAPDVQTFARLQSVPGIGTILALVIRYESQDSARFPRGQAFVSYCRLVKCAKASAGQRHGLWGKKIGNPQLKWAFSEAAVLFWRQNHPGKEYCAKLERKHGKGKALTILAHQVARAVYYLLTRAHACDLPRFVTASQ